MTVNAIAPGAFLTEPNLRWSRLSSALLMETLARADPIGEFGRPEDLGPLAVYLASDACALHDGRRPGHRRGYTAW